MSALVKFERKTIPVQTDGETKLKPVWAYGEVFVINTRLDGNERWQIGCSSRDGAPMFPIRRLGLFEYLEDACAGAIQISEAHSWVGVDNFSDEDKALFDKIHKEYNTFVAVATPELKALIDMLKASMRPTIEGGLA